MQFTKTLMLVLILALGAGRSALTQTPTWKADFVGSAPAGSSGAVAAVAVNDAGVVAGFSYFSGYKRAWVGSPGSGISLLPIPAGANWSEPYDINASGTIVGRILLSGSISRGVVWTPGPNGYQVNGLPVGPGGLQPFDALAVNDFGEVVGKYGVLGGSYSWTASTGITQYPTTLMPVVPKDINNQRQVIGDTYRMDLDTLVLENLGNPVGTGFNYIFSVLWRINDAGQCGGYGNTATGQSQSKQAIRYTDGPTWKAFNSIPLTSANVMGIAESGDTAFQLGIYGSYIYVEGHGSIGLANTLGPAYADWDLSGSFAPVISRGGLIACNGANTSTGEAGIVLLTPLAFEDLGGSSSGPLGPPVLGGFGDLTPGSLARVRLAAAASNSWAHFLVSSFSNPVTVFGGTLFAYPFDSITSVPTDSFGRHDATVIWPLVPPGTTYFVQVVVVEAGSFEVSMSNALKATTR